LPVAKRKLGFQASIAEFLLVNRLRARRPAQPSADVLERASRIVFVTCQNWFAKPRTRPAPTIARVFEGALFLPCFPTA
jgi:hypothetical protein